MARPYFLNPQCALRIFYIEYNTEVNNIHEQKRFVKIKSEWKSEAYVFHFKKQAYVYFITFTLTRYSQVKQIAHAQGCDRYR